MNALEARATLRISNAISLALKPGDEGDRARSELLAQVIGRAPAEMAVALAAAKQAAEEA